MKFTKKRIVENFKNQISKGKLILAAGVGSGISAKSEEAGGADLLIVTNAGKFIMAGRGSLAGFMPYGDANQIVMDIGREVLPLVKNTPVIAGVCSSDPFRKIEIYLKDLKKQGFNGVQNFPTVGLIDGILRANLEETGMGYNLEIEMIRIAHELNMLTIPYVFDENQARKMAKVGADIIIAHMGLTTKGTIGALTSLTLDECVNRTQSIANAAKKINPEIIVLCHGGQISEPKDVKYVLEKTKNVDGFFGASSIERLAVEVGIKKQTKAFRNIMKNK